MPIIGGKARFQPVYVDDVARAVIASLADTARFGGKTFELGGPETISMADLNKRIAQEIGVDASFVEMPDALVRTDGQHHRLAARRTDHAAINGRCCRATMSSPHGAEGLEAFGIAPTPMAAVIGEYLVRFRKHGRFGVRTKPKVG